MLPQESGLDMSQIAQKAVSDGDPKILLALLLSLIVYVLREHLLAKTPQDWGRVGAAMRWLGSTHFGGVASSILAAGFGAVVTAVQSGSQIKPATLLNVFVVASMASGMATWSKLGKRKEQPKAKRQDEPSLDADAAPEQAKPESEPQPAEVVAEEAEVTTTEPVEVVSRPSKKRRPKAEQNGEIKPSRSRKKKTQPQEQ